MASLQVTMSGSTLLPSAVTKGYGTFSDADFQRILNWVKVAQAPLVTQMFNPSGTPGFVPTNSQLYQAWVQSWVNQSINQEAAFSTPAPVPPAPVVIGP